jgi:hypothetical protein
MKLKELFETEERSISSFYGPQPDPYHGSFMLDNLKMTSLVGSPEKIDGTMSCSNNLLRSLKGGPVEVAGKFNCYNNELTSLEGGPKLVGGSFNCEYNQITSLEGVARIISGVFYCSGNNLTSLKGIHKQIKYIGVFADFQHNPIRSHVLGLLKINGLEGVFFDDSQLAKIITKYLKGDRDIFACQEELIEAGFEEFAQL